MRYDYMAIAATPAVQAAQALNGSRGIWESLPGDRRSDRFTAAEASFIAARDSFYMATVSETGWPYLQHRGGPPGFLRMLDDTTLGCADFRGNRQYISLGNLAANDRSALFLMDYPNRRRLKIYAHATTVDLSDDPDLAAALALPGSKAKVERGLVFRLAAFDWNCPQHITPRFTEAEIDSALAPVRAEMARLEAENETLRRKLASIEDQDGHG
jgi:uncharacterized protein